MQKKETAYLLASGWILLCFFKKEKEKKIKNENDMGE